MPTAYDVFAPLYPAWTASAPVAAANRAFYVEPYLRTEGPVVELGVGDGPIALEAVRRGRAQLVEAGFELEAVHGDFAGTPFDGGSLHQVCFARHPC